MSSNKTTLLHSPRHILSSNWREENKKFHEHFEFVVNSLNLTNVSKFHLLSTIILCLTLYLFDLCPRPLNDLELSNFDFWIFVMIFSTEPACRKQQQMWDVQNMTCPNWWAAKDIKQKWLWILSNKEKKMKNNSWLQIWRHSQIFEKSDSFLHFEAGSLEQFHQVQACGQKKSWNNTSASARRH